MKKPRPPIAEVRAAVEALVGYEFSDKERLDRALTHSSAKPQKGSNYERMEFLGDRVLGLCIAELLFRSYGQAREGSCRFASTSSSAPKAAPRSPTISACTPSSAPAPM